MKPFPTITVSALFSPIGPERSLEPNPRHESLKRRALERRPLIVFLLRTQKKLSNLVIDPLLPKKGLEWWQKKQESGN